jgi:protein phosphatase PTC2/3
MADLNSKPSPPKASLPRFQSLSSLTSPLSPDPAGVGPQSSRSRLRHDSQPVFPLSFHPASTRSAVPPLLDPPKHSTRSNGSVKAYAACTSCGLVRTYNEDRVSIVLNITQNSAAESPAWPSCSFFGVFDGHGGTACADFLRDSLHQYIVRSRYFPHSPKEALLDGFRVAESEFLQKACSAKPLDRSGSCAIVVLVVGSVCYVANLGDSRALMASSAGNKIYPLSKDHKPQAEDELKRIIENGGKIYQSVTQNNGSPVLGPYRVFPGRLSVSRTFGDAEAKVAVYGGNCNVLSAVPDVKAFQIHEEYEFIVLGSDGVFDKMTNREVVQSAVAGIVEGKKKNLHEMCAGAAENVMRMAMIRRSLDNVTVVVVGLEGMSKFLN